ncbi:MAG: hypothetical protein HY579_12070 [Nitrospinae bacterium]|nr:hypothetical protein [Nitrospinota bacterium]
MREPKRVLQKILGPGCDADAFAATGEPLELVVELLRETLKCRKARQWLLELAGFDIAVSPRAFHALLDLREINCVETTTRDLDIKVESLRDSRHPDDPVSIGNLNSVLRELYRDLQRTREKMAKEFPALLLKRDVTAALAAKIPEWVAGARGAHWNGVGFLFTGWKVRGIENEFRSAFPNADRAHPLREKLAEVERESEFYRFCAEANGKWSALGLDLFRILRADALNNVCENLEGAGNALWNLVYNSPPARVSLELAGIRFDDISTLFENERVAGRG